jgi:hypothetical protein
MSDQFSMFDPPTSEGTTSATSLPESAAGPTPSDLPDGPTTAPSGPAPVPVSRFRARASKKAMPTSDTSGPLFTNSSPSADLQRSLENRLRQRMAGSGSPEYALTWKMHDMPSGPPICALRASGRRTSGKDFSGWPTPNAGPQNDTDTKWQERRARIKAEKKNGNGFGLTLGMAASLTAELVSGWPSHPDARPPRAGANQQPKSARIQPERNGSGKEGTASRLADADEGQRGRLADGKGRQHYGAPTGRQARRRYPQVMTRSGGADSRLADADGGHPGAEREQRSGEQRQQPQDGGTGERVADAEGTKHPHNATTDRPGKGAQVEPRGGGLLSGGLDGRMGDADDTGSQGRGQHFGQHADQQPPWSASDLIPCADGKWRRVPANEAGEPEPGLFPLAHGVSNRVGTLRGAGNAITPQVAAAFIDAFASSCS